MLRDPTSAIVRLNMPDASDSPHTDVAGRKFGRRGAEKTDPGSMPDEAEADPGYTDGNVIAAKFLAS